ncbi:UDP-N-acetylmuramate dehydrogenase [Methylobacillus rhizosphaerae]|uniref:UDP-N-acetylenolpyruvoylglucosamine reductase n=1 Tax=Methylobacillus rhizosphaerae TaxID=551994 RepID=A0A238Y101_9PROT|nr:UDP-N-acetylmuramate dehydrogenase [Methylobacillus rhizosphaerae]SNR63979.1 UDP-N-acetylmuramate dehydrogenase [Methylobacillus rhizosphaerae]
MAALMTGSVLKHEPLARYTSWRVGGAADQLYIPAGLEDLQHFLAGLPQDEALHFIGLGSNLLVRDGGVRGTVVLMHGALTTLAAEHGFIYAEAGVTCAKLAKFAARQHQHGAEFMAGIPGTVGGALAMNAGCHGGETWEIVDRVLTIDRQGKVHERNCQAFATAYRHVEMPVADEWFIAAWFRLEHGDAGSAEAKIKQLLARRLETQPLNLPNAGSVFRNPAGDHAARLIEASGLKGYRMGGAQVSEKHANFIVNTGDATAADIEQLIAYVRQTVKREQKVELQQEVRIIGEYA